MPESRIVQTPDPSVKPNALSELAPIITRLLRDRAPSSCEAILDEVERLRPESAIEGIFAAWWGACRAHVLGCGLSRMALQLRSAVWVNTTDGRSYRLDFAVEPQDGLLRELFCLADLSLRFAIELDGHDFHERTKEQVISRDRRDRDLQELGWRVFHVSGSELKRNPAAVVLEALSAAGDAIEQRKAELLTRGGLVARP